MPEVEGVPAQEPVATPETAPESVPTEVTTEPENTPEPAVVDNDKWDPETRKHIEDLRKENAKYRTRAQKFEATFSDLDDATTEGLLGLVSALKNGDQAAVPVLESILSELSPKEQEALKEAIAEDEPKNLTPEEVEKMIEEREAKKEADQVAKEQFEAMRTEIEGLGYSLKEDEPNVDTSALFFFLGQQPQDQAPDIKKAHAQVEEWVNGKINAWKDSVNEKNSRFARIAAAGATPQGVDGGKKKLRLGDGSAGKAALEYLNNAQ